MNPLDPLRRLRQPLVKGHPFHAMLTDVPAGTLPVSLGLDLLSRLSGRDRFRTSALDTFAAAWLAGLATVAAGWWDYANVPAERPELMEKELERDGLTGYAERARAEVARYEREETLIP